MKTGHSSGISTIRGPWLEKKQERIGSMSFFTILRRKRAAITVFIVASVVLAVGFVASKLIGARTAPVPPRSGTAADLLQQIAEDLDPLLIQSRKMLLGRRPPGDRTCIAQSLDAQRVLLQADPNGGPGLRFVAFCSHRPDVPLPLYDWSQNHLKPYLQSEHTSNAPILARTEKAAHTAAELALKIADGERNPPSHLPKSRSMAWPGQCWNSFVNAIDAKDFDSAKVWADELASATFALADLHRWLDLLYQNNLRSLEFQALCRNAFEWAQPAKRTPYEADGSFLPAAATTVIYGQNLLEVEHQAETIFAPAPEWAAIATGGNTSVTTSARSMPPNLRQAFCFLRSKLSTNTRRVWDTAAGMRLSRSYMSNMIFRAVSAGALEHMSVVLERLDKSHDRVGTEELMDAMFYRAGLYSSGFQWADRYDPRVFEIATKIMGEGEAVGLRAQKFTHDLLGDWKYYSGGAMTLARAMDTRRIDCVRGTDLIGALYRNAGHGEYYIARLRCGTTGHSVGVIPVDRNDREKMRVLDPLTLPAPGARWPASYFRGINWPERYPGRRAPLFAAELYCRGLDGYIFAQGYVVRGPHAGKLLQAGIPYLPDRQASTCTRIYEGPYPAAPPPITSDTQHSKL